MQRRHLSVFLSALAILFLTGGCISESKDNQSSDIIEVGNHMPRFEVMVTDPATDSTFLFSSEKLQGETVIVFFETSCKDCQRELPRLNDYYLRHRGESGFQFVAISRAQSQQDVAAYWQSKGLAMPYSAQDDRRIYDLFARSVIPRVYFCSPEGIITKIYVEVLPEEL